MTVPIIPKGYRLSFFYGNEEITFERTERPKASGKVLIKVHSDCRVIAAAPQDVSNEAVLAAVKKRGRWIYEQRRNFRKQMEHATPRKFISGESHYYLGKQYLLKVQETPHQPQSVKLFRGKLEVSVRQKNPMIVSELLMAWYKSRAKEIFASRLDALLDQTLWVPDRPPLRLLTMQTQWGSCSPNGRITLNPHLVKAPRECIDYVILHELCHIAEHNHSNRFYRLMEQVMPNWETTKGRLDGMANRIIGP